MRWDLILSVVGGVVGTVMYFVIAAFVDDVKREGGFRAWVNRGRLNAIYHNMKMCPNCNTGDIYNIESCPVHRAQVEQLMRRMGIAS